MITEQIHELRQQIDVLIQQVANEPKNEQGNAYDRTMEKVLTHLEEAKMWSGKALGTLGNELPPEYSDNSQ